MTRPPEAPVRLARADDFDRWFVLFEAVAGEGRWLGAELPMDREARLGFFESCLPCRDSALFLAEATPDGSLVGALNISLSGTLADLGMFVAAGARGGGVGSALMDAALGWAKERAAHKITLAVWPHNAAGLALYTKFGFVTEGRRRRHWRRRNGELWDSIQMGLILDQTTPGGPDPVPGPRAIAFPELGLPGGDQVEVRPWSRRDVPALAAAMADPDVRSWIGAPLDGWTADSAETYVAGARVHAANGGGLRLAIVSAGEPAGFVNLHVDPYDPAIGGIGYFVLAPARGRGLATSAVRILSEWALGPGGLRRMELNTEVGNTAARKVADRTDYGMEGIRRAWRTVDGEPRDFALYSRVTTASSAGDG